MVSLGVADAVVDLVETGSTLAANRLRVLEEIGCYETVLVQNKSIDIYNNGNMIRDFTYIDDIIEGITRVIQINNNSPFEVYNIGNDNPINLMDFIKIMENYFKKKFKINFLPHQLGDVKSTHASIENFSNHYNYKPKINLDEGIKNFVTWYKSYNK